MIRVMGQRGKGGGQRGRQNERGSDHCLTRSAVRPASLGRSSLPLQPHPPSQPYSPIPSRLPLLRVRSLTFRIRIIRLRAMSTPELSSKEQKRLAMKAFKETSVLAAPPAAVEPSGPGKEKGKTKEKPKTAPGSNWAALQKVLLPSLLSFPQPALI